MVGDAALAAIGFDYFLGLAKFVAGHGGEEVMLDLAGEAAHAVVDAGMFLDVAAGEDLFAQEVDSGAAFLQRHALMVGSEDQGEIEAEEGLLRQDKQHGMRKTKKVREKAEEPNRVEDEETDLDGRVRDFAAQEEADAIVFQEKRLEQRQREKREMLVFDGEAREAVFGGRLSFGKCEGKNIHVGIGGDVVGRAMMAIVFVEPPTIAETQQEIRMQQAERFIAGGLAENFLVAGVVDDEAELGEDKGEDSGVAEFEPRILKPFDQQECADEKDQVNNYFTEVIGRLLCQ